MSHCEPGGGVAVEPPGPRIAGKISTVALIGPPNSGKSTLFNRLTGLRQKVANYPGVTVEQHSARMSGIGHRELTLIDLPGIYSLNSYSEDARVAIDVLQGNMPGTPAPDAVLLVLDALQLNRQLMLAAPVLAMGLPTLVLLNMSDLMTARGGEIDPLALARELGAPVAMISASKGTGFDAISRFLVRLSEPLEVRLQPMQLPVLQNAASCHQWASGVSSRTKYKAPNSSNWTRRLDAVLLHKIWGPLIFLAVVIGVFQVVFAAGLPLSDWLTEIFTKAGATVVSFLPVPWLQVLLRDGLWNGVQAVLVFLPQILLLFLVIGVLEDSGYLARAALIADRVMRSIGLNGKAFIPLLSAYACAVPAIMATRTIENKRDRLATILVAPFMTCAARLPIYTLIIAAFIPNRPILGDFFGLRAAVMLSLYVLGFLAALATARILKSSILKANAAPFILELPQYRWPTLRSIGLRLLDRGRVFRCANRNRNPGGYVCSVVIEHCALSSRQYRAVDRECGRKARPFHRAGHTAARLQLEDRHRATLLDHRARSDRGHPGDSLWRRPSYPVHRTAGGTAARHDHRRRYRPGGLFRLRHAMHLHPGRSTARDQ